MELKFKEVIRQRLTGPLPGIPAQMRMAARYIPRADNIPKDARASAVLALLYPREAELTLLLIRRTQDGNVHGGQISFPGGKKEQYDADLRATALREAQEEVGIMSDRVEILGGLTQLYIPVSNFQVFPFVAYSESRPLFQINTTEVDEIIEVPMHKLLQEEFKSTVSIRSNSAPTVNLKVPAYVPADNQIIWGATAMILAEFETVLHSIQ